MRIRRSRDTAAAVSEPTILPNVAIVGRPNVGKSALFNRLAGRKIAIVHNQPGITRDRISAVSERGSRPFRLWDTGGIFGGGETELTDQVRQAAEAALLESDLLLFVVDAKQGLSPIDQDLARMLRKLKKPVVLVINKIDDDKHETLAGEFEALGFETSVSISAEHNRGISDLLARIEQHLRTLPALQQIERQTSNLKRPVAVAIVGRPNVGKSSLINAIVRDKRAIVSEMPGTTRDAVDIVYEQDGRKFVLIDTAGMRRRGKHSSSAEVFSVMRAERSIRRADICVLIVDLTMGVTAQDKRVAGLIQKARKPAIIVLNKWDLVRTEGRQKLLRKELVDEARAQIFFLEYAPLLITSALTGENVERLFVAIASLQRAAEKHIGTGVLNRLLRGAFEANPPPMIKGRRLKLLYATQAGGDHERQLQPPEFVLFVNDSKLINETYRRYLEARIRKAEAYPGLPIILTLRARTQRAARAPRVGAR